MNIALWVLQGVSAFIFLMAGFTKATQPLDTLTKRMGWIPNFPPAFVRFIGISEVLGAIGLIIPALTHILPWLTPTAAVGLVIIMGGAAFVHFSRKEYPGVGSSIVILLLVAFVAYGRFVLFPL